MDNLIRNLCAFAGRRESLVSVIAIRRAGSAKYLLLLCGPLFLSGCLSLRLGENQRPKQAPTRAFVAYVDQEATIARQ
jgi:hypothetical protein